MVFVLLREYPGTLRELRECLFYSESGFPEIGVVPRALIILSKITYTYIFRKFSLTLLKFPRVSFKSVMFFFPQGRSAADVLSETSGTYKTYTYISEMLGDKLLLELMQHVLTLTFAKYLELEM